MYLENMNILETHNLPAFRYSILTSLFIFYIDKYFYLIIVLLYSSILLLTLPLHITPFSDNLMSILFKHIKITFVSNYPEKEFCTSR